MATAWLRFKFQGSIFEVMIKICKTHPQLPEINKNPKSCHPYSTSQSSQGFLIPFTQSLTKQSRKIITINQQKHEWTLISHDFFPACKILNISHISLSICLLYLFFFVCKVSLIQYESSYAINSKRLSARKKKQDRLLISRSEIAR